MFYTTFKKTRKKNFEVIQKPLTDMNRWLIIIALNNVNDRQRGNDQETSFMFLYTTTTLKFLYYVPLQIAWTFFACKGNVFTAILSENNFNVSLSVKPSDTFENKKMVVLI